MRTAQRHNSPGVIGWAAMALITSTFVPCLYSQGNDTVFSDDFTGLQLRREWRASAGQWALRDGRLENAAPGGGVILIGDADWDDYCCDAVLVTLKPGPRPWSVARLLARYQNTANYYYLLAHRDGLIEIGKEHRGEHHPCMGKAKLDVDPLREFRLRLSAQGARLQVLVDGQTVIELEDSDPLLRGQVGLDAFQGAQIAVSSFSVTSAKLKRETQRKQDMADRTLKALGYSTSTRGNIGIFRDSHVPVKDSFPSAPEFLSDVLSSLGYGITFLDAVALADPGVLSTSHFDLLILPYGAAFPRPAADAFRRFLQHGGSFLSTGGYFADNLYDAEGREGELVQLLTNPGFEDDLNAWEPSHADVRGLTIGVESQPEPTRRCVRLALDTGEPITWYSVRQRVEGLEPGTPLLARARVKAAGVKGGNGGYLALNYYREDGTRIRFDQSNGVRGTCGWTGIETAGTVPPQTAWIMLDLILHGAGQAWFDDAELRPVKDGTLHLNTRHGDIRGPGNSLRVSPQQIGVFAPNYRLEHVSELRTSPHQHVLGDVSHLPLQATGYSASGVFTGNGNPVAAVQHARTIHLLDAHDRFGRLRGRAGALVRNYRGTYAGSDWAVFGVNNADLFAADRPQSEMLLGQTVHALMQRTYIAEAHPEFACYRRGETVALEAILAHFARSNAEGRVRFAVTAESASGPAVFETEVPVELGRTGLHPVAASWTVPANSADFYVVEAQLLVGATVIDSLRNAFVVWDEDVLAARGPAIEVSGSYLARNGATTFLCGTGDSGYPYFSESETPIVWDTQFRLMRDYALRYYRCMHFFSGFPDVAALDEANPALQKRLRRLDALVYLSHKHGLMYLFVDNFGLQFAREDPGDLSRRQRILALIATRYKHAKGFLFNLDHQEFIRSKDERSHAAFRRFLSAQYTSTSDLSKAWQTGSIPSLDGVRFDESAAQTCPWSSSRGRDTGAFLWAFRESWRRNSADAVHQGNPSAIHAQDFSLYWWPDFPWPDPPTLDRLDMVSAHFYGDEDVFPVRAKRCDMQLLGKPVGMTEFGTLTHPAWEGHRDARLSPAEAEQFFMMVGHYCLGLGITMMSNWNWKEMRECIFPWSIVQQDLVPKAHFAAYRNLALLLSSFSPRYEPPEVFLVVPSANLKREKFRAVEAGLGSAIKRLLEAGVRFGLVGEQYLSHVPASTRALFYPTPYCVADEVFEQLVSFVAGGGTLYISGDFSLDAEGRDARPERLSRLAGVQFVAPNYEPMDGAPARDGRPQIRVEPAQATALADTEHGPGIVCNAIGRGHVVYDLNPAELYGGEIALTQEQLAPLRRAGALQPQEPEPGQRIQIYELALTLANVSKIPIAPRDRSLFVSSLPTHEGGTVYVLFNTDVQEKAVRLSHQGRTAELTVAARRPALAVFGANAELTAIECQDRALFDGQLLWEGKGHFGFISLDGRGLGQGCIQLLAMAIGDGSAVWHGTGSGQQLVADCGEFRDGRWYCLALGEPGSRPELNAHGALRSSLMLLTTDDGRARGKMLAEQLLTR